MSNLTYIDYNNWFDILCLLCGFCNGHWYRGLGDVKRGQHQMCAQTHTGETTLAQMTGWHKPARTYSKQARVMKCLFVMRIIPCTVPWNKHHVKATYRLTTAAYCSGDGTKSLRRNTAIFQMQFSNTGNSCGQDLCSCIADVVIADNQGLQFLGLIFRNT